MQKIDNRDEEVLAERTRYKLEKERGKSTILRPHGTLILRGIDQFARPSPIYIVLTQYANTSGTVDVYKFVNKIGDAVSSFVIVGCPNLDLTVQRRLAFPLKIPT